MPQANPQAVGLFLESFFDELCACGVRNVVVCPGSRSTPLAMTAFELSQRDPKRLRVLVDVDERGAAFVALGMGKATGVPAAVVCTSGSAVANFYPAVLEAESSGVPLLLLTGDRPPQLQGLGAPQTCDQLHLFGSHVRAFRQMPVPAATEDMLVFARQAAKEAVIACAPRRGLGSLSVPVAGASTGGAVHLNFPFDEPLKPDFSEHLPAEALGNPSLVAKIKALRSKEIQGCIAPVSCEPSDEAIESLVHTLRKKRVLMVAGDGAAFSERDARAVLDLADYASIPVLADPLSGLRCRGYGVSIESYDAVLGSPQGVPEALRPDAVIRFGRYPVSKRLTQWLRKLSAEGMFTVVVDPCETRDFNAATDIYLPCSAACFASAITGNWIGRSKHIIGVTPAQRSFLSAWMQANENVAAALGQVESDEGADAFEGAYVHALMDELPPDACLFVGNSMSIRAVDTFCRCQSSTIQILGNRGLNGIDGTVSTMFGASWAQPMRPVTLLVGDLALLHDLNALALQRELFALGLPAPSITIVLLNNNGGAIFDMLPQQSDEPYFERLFLTPQDVDFESAARAFSVPYQRVDSVAEFREAYQAQVGKPGFHLIEINVPLRGVKDRYAPYWGLA
ncbi:2-succinyl-5-enolpyruvyl-6-hydroxy-3-cyclohexene-1-carboxylic-acid synthase [Eggerthellaceae bacterium zg-887]|uniref:2-succinyl-5-enolpyruvyl-6-hydroxy-3- cyclohexene-1-carboxylic-acid synthase n=1 Tax=Xiamenia xianingshaonis TaxID=2682776 RepID=UPI0014072E83|nr:2-succinyl-5-enolpyruvyl-6-hydroxy-3-cyclohexene-1-carboxylic-acid synthase [Xiamenia xianingshaonis]NHM16900.1 2-succinyl-5-enolpyruvyl-6-hydroxy-3-cyclohexene-1-carboxylic-acid synthase [Xiamenia xianingshaonis]